MKTKYASLVFSSLIFVGCSAQDQTGRKMMSLLSGSSTTLNSKDPGSGGGAGGAPIVVNGKVFNRSPVGAGAKEHYDASGASPSTPINFDKYLTGVEINGTTGGVLKNKDVDVMNASGETTTRAKSDAQGNWNFSSVGDSTHSLGQLVMYYWLAQEKITFENILPGSWGPGGKNISVFARCQNFLNASWQPASNMVCIGYQNNIELAFDGSVYAHEMGHAHLTYNANGQADGFTSNCPTANGCIGAIHEGQADVHSQILFNISQIGEFAFNNPAGFTGRDAAVNSNLTAQAMFSQSSEVHDMGSVYAAAWWTLRLSIGVAATNKIFAGHLQYLNSSYGFKEALNNAVIMADQQLYGSSHKSQILAAFSQHGITP